MSYIFSKYSPIYSGRHLTSIDDPGHLGRRAVDGCIAERRVQRDLDQRSAGGSRDALVHWAFTLGRFGASEPSAVRPRSPHAISMLSQGR